MRNSARARARSRSRNGRAPLLAAALGRLPGHAAPVAPAAERCLGRRSAARLRSARASQPERPRRGPGLFRPARRCLRPLLDPFEPAQAPGRGGRAGPALACAAHGLVPLERARPARGLRRRRRCGPFEIAANRVARPFRDAASWTHGLVQREGARTAKLRKRDRSAAAAERRARPGPQQENASCTSSCTTSQSPTLPEGLRRGRRRACSRARSTLDQSVTISAGSTRGIAPEDVVVTTGRASSARSRRCSRDESQRDADHRSDERRRAPSTRRTRPRSASSTTAAAATRSSSTGSARTRRVNVGDTIITAGSPAAASCPRSSRATSRSATSRASGQTDTDIYKDIQVQPFVDLSSLESVLVLIPKPPATDGRRA